MADDKDAGNKKLALTYATENRKSEIALLWSRSLYFWGFISVIFVAYGGAVQSKNFILALLAACFGFICSLCWTLANRSGKYWQEVWEEKTKIREVGIIEPPLFPRETNPFIYERWIWGPKQYSPSKLAMAVSDATTLVWLVLICGTAIPIQALLSQTVIKIGLVLCTMTYAVAVLIWCRSGKPWNAWTAWKKTGS